MKKAFIASLLVAFSLQLQAQVTEGRSGIQQFNISKNKTDFSSGQKRAVADMTAPVLKIENPVLSADSVVVTADKTLLVRGTVSDEGGIFEVMANGVEAKVSADGIFLAEVPQAIGRNRILITATDVSMNRSDLVFYSDRSADVIPEIEEPENRIITKFATIEFLSPSEDHSMVASDLLKLKVCIKSSEEVNKVIIYHNGQFAGGSTGSSGNTDGEYALELNEQMSLNLGNNEIRVDAYVKGDTTVSSTINVEYSLYAARNFALLIANEKYDNPNIMDLAQPARDVKELYGTLTKYYEFDPENVILLTNSTKSEIIGTLQQLRSKITPEDNLLIFYAGHGYWDEGMGVGYWLPRDADPENPSDWIPNTDLTNYLGAIHAKHTLLVADACFSGSIFKTRSAFSETYAIEMLYQLNSRKAITSGTLTEVPDKSAFFFYFNKSLKDNTLPYLSSEELFSKMRIAVINNSENVPQFGTIQNVGDEGGDFIFIHRR